MIYKIMSLKNGRYWLFEFANKKDAIKYARKVIKQDYYDNADECVHPSVRDYVNQGLSKLSFVKFKNSDLIV